MPDLMVSVRLGSIFNKLGQLLGKHPDVTVLVSKEPLLVVRYSLLVR